MFPLLGAIAAPLITGAIGAVGQNATNVANARQAREAQAFSAAEAEKNRQFQEEMSGSSYQRAVKDLKAAGLNPALAYQQGGANSPSGSTASGQAARMDSSAGAGLSTARSAVDFVQNAAMNAATRERIEADTDLTHAQASNVRTMMLANLDEVQARGDAHTASAGRNRAESAVTTQSFDARMQVLRSEFLRNVASAEEARSRIGLQGTQRELMSLGIPVARNMAKAADTMWGRNVTPYLNDAQALSRMFGPWMQLMR